MDIVPEKKQMSIVLIGEFNPAMFQPEWFANKDIISPEDVETARSQNSSIPLIVTPDITVFRLSQLSIRIDRNRFQVLAEKEPFVSVKDFIIKTFETLGGYVIPSFGYNYSAHYKIEDKSLYQKIGDRLAPKQYWKTLLGDEVTGDDRKSGLSSMRMSKSKDDNSGYILMVLEPSNTFHPGIYINCNDHYNLKKEDQCADIVIEKIGDEFEQEIEYIKKLHDDLIREVIAND